MNDNVLINGNIQGPAKIWFVGGIFLIAGVVLGVLITTLITPRHLSIEILAQGEVIDYNYDSDQENQTEVFSFTTESGQRIEKQGSIWSSQSAYQIGENVEVYYTANDPQGSARIKDDKNLIIVNYILQGLGLYFAFFGLVIVLLKLREVPDFQIERLAGIFGSLSFGVPATLALPVLYYFFANRPNYLFEAGLTAMPEDILALGIVFSVMGVMDILATYFIYRAVSKTQSNFISYGSRL